MAASIETISDAIKQQIRSLPAFNADTVISYPPDVAQWVEDALYNTPFCGISLSSLSHDNQTADGSVAEQTLSFTLMIIEENPNLSQATDKMNGYIDSIIGVLQGDSMGVPAMLPIEIGECAPGDDIPDEGLVVYMMNISMVLIRGNT